MLIVLLLVLLSWFIGVISAIAYYQCPSLESFLTLVTGTPLATDLPLPYRNQVPIAERLRHALLQARVATALQQQWYLVFRMVSLGYGITFYGIFKRWGASGNYRHVFVSFRDHAPLVDYYLHDDETPRTIAHEWHAAEQAMVNQHIQQSFETFWRIIDRLKDNPSPVAQVDAAISCLMAWQVTDQGLDQDLSEAAKQSLIQLAELVNCVPHPPIVRWIQITIADILTNQGHDTLEMYQQQLIRGGWWPYDETYYHCITQIAYISSARGEYDKVITFTGRALRYYKQQLDVDVTLVSRLVLVRCIAFMARSQWDMWLQERSLVDSFGKSSPELVFVGRLYNAWYNRDISLYELAFRDFDREYPVDDQDVRIIASGKERLKDIKKGLL